MSENDYKPRGSLALVAFLFFVVSLPVIGILALSYFQIIVLPDDFFGRILTQIGWNSVFSPVLMIVVYLVARKISNKVNADKNKRPVKR